MRGQGGETCAHLTAQDMGDIHLVVVRDGGEVVGRGASCGEVCYRPAGVSTRGTGGG